MLVDALLERAVTRIVVNTNGLRVARDDQLLAFLAERRGRVEVYLQYDGPRGSAWMAVRGADLLQDTRTRALGRLTDARVFTTLTCTVTDESVDDADVGDVLRAAVDTDYVGGVVFQPLFGTEAVHPRRRVTTTGVIRQAREPVRGMVAVELGHSSPCHAATRTARP